MFQYSIKVLLINDEVFILQILTTLMLKESIKYIDIAYNGFEGYNMVLKNSYDFVVCDLNMPVMDGFQFCSNTVKYFKEQIQIFDSQQ